MRGVKNRHTKLAFLKRAIAKCVNLEAAVRIVRRAIVPPLCHCELR
jgi:hypothetical protein